MKHLFLVLILFISILGCDEQQQRYNNPCYEITCSNHGKCSVIEKSKAICICDTEFNAKGLECVENKYKKIYGVTLDSVNDINEILDSIKSLPEKVITRIVFDEVPATEYLVAVKRLYKDTYIMGQLFDSEYINNYSLDAYSDRIDEYLNTFGDKIKIWEIGNEVNGEWTGNPDIVAQKVMIAYQKVKNKGYKTVLTLYYNDFEQNDGCWANKNEKMREWARIRLNQNIKEGIDYVFISYYEEDCNNHKPTINELEKVFSDLENIFPNAKLGFGEVGTSNSNEKERYLEKYYTLNISNHHYVGGYFWWYFKDDMVPKSKKLWSVLNQIMKN